MRDYKKLLSSLKRLWQVNYNFRLITLLGVLIFISATFIFVLGSKKQKTPEAPQKPPTSSIFEVEPICTDNPPGAIAVNPDRSKYTWKADCQNSNSCYSNGTNSNCPQNQSLPVEARNNSNWCYGFNGPNHDSRDFRCLQLQYLHNPPSCTDTENDPQSRVNMNVQIDKTRIDSSIVANVSAENKSTGSTWIEDSVSPADAVTCPPFPNNAQGFYGTLTCHLKSGVQSGTEITWTHKWKNCLESPSNCFETVCSKQLKFKVPVKIDGIIFDDKNSNNQRDAGENGINGAKVRLKKTGSNNASDTHTYVTQTDSTKGTGYFIFSVPPDRYDGDIENLQTDFPGYHITNPDYPFLNTDIQTDLPVEVGMVKTVSTSTPTSTLTPTATNAPTHAPTATLTLTPTPTLTLTPTQVPTATLTPTTPPIGGDPTNTQAPTHAPTATSAPTTTHGVTSTTAPTTTGGGTGTAKIALTLKLQAIGKNENPDPQHPTKSENPDPKTPTREIKVEIFDAQNVKKADGTGNITYNSASGLFKGTVDVSNLTTGDYSVKVKTNKYLRRLIGKETNKAIQHIVAGPTPNQMPESTLVVGDINNDNNLNIDDYNIYYNCWGTRAGSSTCSDPNKIDLNDDGIIDGRTNMKDYAWLFYSFQVQKGD